MVSRSSSSSRQELLLQTARPAVAPPQQVQNAAGGGAATATAGLQQYAAVLVAEAMTAEAVADADVGTLVRHCHIPLGTHALAIQKAVGRSLGHWQPEPQAVFPQ